MGFDFTGLGKQTLGGHRQKLVCNWSQKKGEMSSQEIKPDFPVCLGVSGTDVGGQWLAVGSLGPAVHKVLFEPSKTMLHSI